MAAGLGRINEAVSVVGRNAAGVVLGVMMAIILAQVVSRYVLNNSISWSEELSKSLMVWTAFLVAPWAYRHGAKVSIDILADANPFRLQAIIRIVINALVLWILGVFFLESLGFVGRGMANNLATVPIPSGLVYAIIPVSLLVTALVAVETILRNVGEALTGRPSPDAPALLSRREA